MPGNHRSGPHGVPVETHKARGSYRADRHGAGADTATGEPEMPRGLTKDERACWDAVVPDLVSRGIAKRIDTLMLRQMAETWGLYRAALVKAKEDPLDRAARMAVVQYRAAFDTIASRYGLTACDRKRLSAVADEVQDDPAEKYFNTVG